MKVIKTTLTQREQDEVAAAARRLSISMAAFVRMAALKAARDQI